jgi:hypothetical protein
MFPARELLPSYQDFIRGLGWRVSQQKNLRIEETGGEKDAVCFAVCPPEEVFLLFAPDAGVSRYRDFFAAAGRAQHHAWTSADLAQRFPAFVFAPDGAVNEGYAALFRAFFSDAAWLREYRLGLEPEAAQKLARAEGWLALAEMRRHCSLLLWELHCETAANLRDEALTASYAQGMTETTGFRHDEAFALSELAAEPFAVATVLRGALLAAALGEHLRVRYGRRWWASRRGGNDLTDWWNTGSRYSAEDLAPAVGAGELSFDLLAEIFREVLQSKP